MPREMPKFTKSAPELVARFHAVMDRHAAPDLVRKQMFGYPGAWIGGNMLTGLFADDWWVRVSEGDREALLALPGAHPLEVMPGKAMGTSVTLPADIVASDPDLDRWVTMAMEYARALPPKSK